MKEEATADELPCLGMRIVRAFLDLWGHNLAWHTIS